MCNDSVNIKEGQLILVTPVGCCDGTYFMDSIQLTNEDGSKSTVNCNHFALAVYSLEFDTVTYAYTLGRGYQILLKPYSEMLHRKWEKPRPLYNMCHQPGSDVV